VHLLRKGGTPRGEVLDQARWKEKDKNKKEDKDKKSSTSTANLTSTSTIDSPWMAVEYSAVTMRDFYLDGAWDAHACNRRDLFDSETFVELKEGDRKVRGFDGSPQSAKGIGTIRLPMRLGKGRPVMWARIPDVLYMPGSANLISQGTIMDRGIRIELINGYGAKLYDTAGGTIATARQRNKMLPLDIAWQHLPREGASVTLPKGSLSFGVKTTRDINGGDPLKSAPMASRVGSPSASPSRVGVRCVDEDPRSFAFMATAADITKDGDPSMSSPTRVPVGSPVGSPVRRCWAHLDPLSFAHTAAATGTTMGGDPSMSSPVRLNVGSSVDPPAGPPIHERWAPHDSLPFAFKAGTGHGKGGDAEFKLCHRSLVRIGLEDLKHLVGSMDHDGIPTFGGECGCICCVRNR
jgi:hypothetical protein